MQVILATPEFIKAEIDARYGSPRRWRTDREGSALRVTTRVHGRRTDEAARLAIRLAQVAVAH